MSDDPQIDGRPQSKGGRARADKLTAAKRSEIAKLAAQQRWENKASSPVHHALDEGVVDLAGTQFRCAVLDGEIRVISGTEFMRVMGLYRSGALSTRRTDEDGFHFPLYLAQKNLRPFILTDGVLMDLLRKPIRYRVDGGAIAEGVPGTVLRRLLSVWVRAHAAGVLGPSQIKTAQKAEDFLDALADVAIDALIDEATGYQKRRAHDSLQQILAAYVPTEFRPYHTKFPSSYYEQLYRVLGWEYNAASSARSFYIGKLTNKLVYERLPPGVHDRIKQRNPIDPITKRRRKKNFQLLTEKVGEPHLDDLVKSAVTLLRATPDGQWKFFEMLFNQAYPPVEPDLFHAQEIAKLSRPDPDAK